MVKNNMEDTARSLVCKIKSAGSGPVYDAAYAELLSLLAPVKYKVLSHKKVYTSGCMDDYSQVCNMAIMRAVNTYNPDLGCKFTTWAFTCMKGYLHRYMESDNVYYFNKSVSEPEDALKFEGAPDVVNFGEPFENPVLNTVFNNLPDNEKTICTLLFVQDKSQADVARALGISRQAVNKKYQRLLSIFRNALINDRNNL